MPALVMFGRSWRIASDDFVYRGIATVLHRICWIIAMKVVQRNYRASSDCDVESTPPWTYSQISFWLFLVITIANIFLIVVSATGNIMNPGPRKHLPKLLYVTLTLATADFGLHLYGVSALFLHRFPPQCLPSVNTWSTYLRIQVGYFLVLNSIKVMLTFLFHYDPLGDKNFQRLVHTQESYSHRQAARATKIWRLRLMILCGCCSLGDDNVHDAFSETSEVLSTFFKNVDLTPSDILAGLILMYEQHWTNSIRRLRGREPFRDDVEFGQREYLADEDLHDMIPTVVFEPADWMNLESAFYYAKFMVGIYGWPLYVMMNCCTAFGKFLPLCGCACRRTTARGNFVIDDNMCMCNATALRQAAGIDEKDLYLVSFTNRVFEVPFYVAADHVHRTVVVTLRGTMSIRDAITDLQTNSLDIGCPDLPPGCAAHQGMVNAAKFVRKRLAETRALESAFGDNPNYGLVVVGHSLGAGAASILGLLLRPDYPRVRCYLYGPPGGLLTPAAAEVAEQFQMSVVVGSDLVPRLGIDTVEELKSKMLHALNQCTIPKYRLFAEGLCEYLLQLSDSSTTQVRQGLQRSYVPILPSCHPRLMLPGRILHLIEFSASDLSDRRAHWRAYWRQAEDFKEVLVAPRMLTDHLPQSAYEALKELGENSMSISNDPRECPRSATEV